MWYPVFYTGQERKKGENKDTKKEGA